MYFCEHNEKYTSHKIFPVTFFFTILVIQQSPFIRSLSPKATHLNKPDVRCTEIAKC